MEEKEVETREGLTVLVDVLMVAIVEVLVVVKTGVT